ncbi:hypothetical protein [Azospirillum canadense]|uniref:hypothetical protein n=1 Tax=Azospirillum canadense TaxID=403962 RepID=UPI0022276335|nr:hypothetical protein [Azospirillum canadense]MCW2240359.1 hypothetical protein [Azospirillum canadense]
MRATPITEPAAATTVLSPAAPSRPLGRRKRRRGVSPQMIAYGAVMVLSVIGLGIAFSAAGDAAEDEKVTQFYSEIIYTAGKIRGSYRGDYTRLGTQTNSDTRLATGGFVPTNYIVAGKATNPWTAPFYATGASATTFTIVLRDNTLSPAVTPAACVQLLTRLASVAGVVSFTSTSVPVIAPATGSTNAATYCAENQVSVTMN